MTTDISCDLEWGGEMKVSIGDQGLDTVEKDYQLYLKYSHDARVFENTPHLDTLDEKGGWRKLWVRMVEKKGFPITL